jgi:hypothetical protein
MTVLWIKTSLLFFPHIHANLLQTCLQVYFFTAPCHKMQIIVVCNWNQYYMESSWILMHVINKVSNICEPFQVATLQESENFQLLKPFMIVSSLTGVFRHNILTFWNSQHKLNKTQNFV